MFKTQSRQQIDKIIERKIKQIPGFNKYTAKFEYVSKHEFPTGVKFGSAKKNTSGSMIKISPCLSSLSNKYIRKRDHLNKKQLQTMDRIDRNFNLDIYLPKD